MTTTSRPGSTLVAIGLIMMVLGIIVPNMLTTVAASHPMTLPFALGIDGFKAGFFLGVALLIIGVRRKQKDKKDGVSRA